MAKGKVYMIVTDCGADYPGKRWHVSWQQGDGVLNSVAYASEQDARNLTTAFERKYGVQTTWRKSGEPSHG